METPHEMHQSVKENLVAMLDTLAARHQAGRISEEDFARTLNYLRFKIGEDLYEAYATPLAVMRAKHLSVIRG